eukprot:CAMPEP_0180650916 /NCGR_PEP_ID=MMETSP1037_2-20121125/52538_1 /TAXON_ID=632150 /ORGANISM="Azadinium spinosum, Strain 3D9" /LENGTH=210 /DNA_ID=CAMNT_0022676393 /DNA_START=82 /DNA_END=712 /DNA_ORIENTATION=-
MTLCAASAQAAELEGDAVTAGVILKLLHNHGARHREAAGAAFQGLSQVEGCLPPVRQRLRGRGRKQPARRAEVAVKPAGEAVEAPARRHFDAQGCIEAPEVSNLHCEQVEVQDLNGLPEEPIQGHSPVLRLLAGRDSGKGHQTRHVYSRNVAPEAHLAITPSAILQRREQQAAARGQHHAARFEVPVAHGKHGWEHVLEKEEVAHPLADD